MGDENRFTKLDAISFKETLARDLSVDLVDDLRDLCTVFGLRPFAVRVVRTRWSGGQRGMGQEYVDLARDILPTPKVEGMGNIDESVEGGGMIEVGQLTIKRIATRYTEEQLRGWGDDSAPPPDDADVFWEIEFLGKTGRTFKRRFVISGTPSYGTFGWTVSLVRAHNDRDLRGELQS